MKNMTWSQMKIAKPKASDSSDSSDSPDSSDFWLLNAVLGFIHGSAAIFMAVVAHRDPTKVPLVTHLPLERFQPRTHSITHVPLEWLSALFLGLACLNHLVGVLRGCRFWSSMDPQALMTWQMQRWFEYSLSASVMHCQLGLLSGVTDVHLLWLIGLGIVSTMACAAGTDYLLWLVARIVSAKHMPYQSIFRVGFSLGWIGFVGAWSVIACYFCSSAINNPPPAFVWVIMVVVLVLDLSFAGVYWKQQSTPTVEYKMKFERVFLVLSLASKQSLAWILFQGSRAVDRN
jgi:hypothetical protein